MFYNLPLFHMVKGTTFIDMSQRYFGGNNPRYMSLMHEAMINHLYETFYYKISGKSLDQWIPTCLEQCRRLIHTKLQNEIDTHEVTKWCHPRGLLCRWSFG